jgi:hypothetical protein
VAGNEPVAAYAEVSGQSLIRAQLTEDVIMTDGGATVVLCEGDLVSLLLIRTDDEFVETSL